MIRSLRNLTVAISIMSEKLSPRHLEDSVRHTTTASLFAYRSNSSRLVTEPLPIEV
jgi:hypothetical protein